MITSELIDLFEIVRKLASSKAELDKKYFDEFIKPVWDKFSEIHENYKITFQGYTKLAIDNNGDTAAVIEQIRHDSVYSENLRSELKSMVSNIPSAFPKTGKEFLEDFLLSLSYYFELRASLKVDKENNDVQMLYAPRWTNAARYRVVVILSRKGNAISKDEVIKVLKETMELLQSNFKWVSESYYKLKKELLT
jgi:hypothetical protein